MRKKSLIIAALILIIDQLIKIMVAKEFSYGTLKTIIPNFFYLTKVYNDGAAWSIFSESIAFLVILAIVALIFLLNYEKSFISNKKNIMAFGLVYGGLLGNLIDRVMYNYVIDYIKLVFGNYHFPIFNFADMSIVIGVLLIFWAIIRGEEKNESRSKK